MASADDEPAGRIAVVVACSPAPGAVEQVTLSLPEGATVAQAVERSGLLPRMAAATLAAPPAFGVWGRLRGGDEPLRDGDRVEIYRPLLIDPKEARRRRQQRARAAAAPR